MVPPPPEYVQKSVNAVVNATLTIDDDNISSNTVSLVVQLPVGIDEEYDIRGAKLMFYRQHCGNLSNFLQYRIPNGDLPNPPLAGKSVTLNVPGDFAGKTMIVDLTAELQAEDSEDYPDITVRSISRTFTAKNDTLEAPVLTALSDTTPDFRAYDGLSCSLTIPTDVGSVREIWVKCISRDLTYSNLFVLDGTRLTYALVGGVYVEVTPGTPTAGNTFLIQIPADMNSNGNLLEQDEYYYLQAQLWYDSGDSTLYSGLSQAYFTRRLMPVRVPFVESNNTVNGVRVKFQPPADAELFNNEVAAYRFMRGTPAFSNSFRTIDNFDLTAVVEDPLNGIDLNFSQRLAAEDFDTDCDGNIIFEFNRGFLRSTIEVDETFWIVAEAADGRLGEPLEVTVPSNTRFTLPILETFEYYRLDGTTELESISSYICNYSNGNPQFTCSITLGTTNLDDGNNVASPNEDVEGPLYVEDQNGNRLDVVSWTLESSEEGVNTYTVEVKTNTSTVQITAFAYSANQNKSLDSISIGYNYQRLDNPDADLGVLFKITDDVLYGIVNVYSGTVDNWAAGSQLLNVSRQIYTVFEQNNSVVQTKNTTFTANSDSTTTSDTDIEIANCEQDVVVKQQIQTADINKTGQTAYSNFTSTVTTVIPPLLLKAEYQSMDLTHAYFRGTLFCVGSENLDTLMVYRISGGRDQLTSIDDVDVTDDAFEFSVPLSNIGTATVYIQLYSSSGVTQGNVTHTLQKLNSTDNYFMQLPPTQPSLGALDADGIHFNVPFNVGLSNTEEDVYTDFKTLPYEWVLSPINQNTPSPSDKYPGYSQVYTYTEADDCLITKIYGRSRTIDVNIPGTTTHFIYSSENDMPYVDLVIKYPLPDLELSVPQPDKSGSNPMTTLRIEVPDYEKEGCVANGTADVRVTVAGNTLYLNQVASGDVYYVVITKTATSAKPASVPGSVEHLTVSSLEWGQNVVATVELMVEEDDIENSSVSLTLVPYRGVNSAVTLEGHGLWNAGTQTFAVDANGTQTSILLTYGILGSFLTGIAIGTADEQQSVLTDIGTAQFIASGTVAERATKVGDWIAAMKLAYPAVVVDIELVSVTATALELRVIEYGKKNLALVYSVSEGHNGNFGFASFAYAVSE
jgi:hypothetical protein